jgi:hypothetical protein
MIGTILVAGDYILEHRLAKRADGLGGVMSRGDTGATGSSVNSTRRRRRLVAALGYAT